MIYKPETYGLAREKFEYLIKNKKKFELKTYRKKRTLNQNNGYWLWLTYLEDMTGTVKDTWHRYFLQRFPTMVEVTVMDRKEMVQITTSDPEMTTARMSVYMNHIDAFASDAGMTLPDLATQKAVEMYEYYREKGML